MVHTTEQENGISNGGKRWHYQAGVRSVSIEIALEDFEFLLQVGCRPESCLVQAFPTDCPNQSLHKRMRPRNVRDCFDFLHLEDTQIGLPLMKPIQRIMIGTQIYRQGLRVNYSIEHPAQCQAIDNTAV